MKKRGEGTLVWLDKSQQWAWRGWVVIDGERVRKQYALKTSVRSVAESKADRILEEERPAAPTVVETFRDAAERIVLEQRDEGIVNWAKRRSRFRRWAYAVCGQVQVTLITADHIRDALAVPLKAGMSKQTILHFRNDFSTVLGALWRADVVKENVAGKVRIPKAAPVDQRRRVIPNDDELVQLLACGKVDREVLVAVFCARCIGGQRTSDLLAADWERVDRVTWRTWEVHRPKTGDWHTHEIPEAMAPMLATWWELSGSPERGPIFPVRRGPRTGERKAAGNSWARRLRKALWVADVGRPLPGSKSALEGRSRPSTGLAIEDCLLQTDSVRTRCTGMHAIRAAYVSATHRVALDPAMQMRLAAHKNWSTHMRYVEQGQVLSLPNSALPSFSTAASLTSCIPIGIQTEESPSAAVEESSDADDEGDQAPQGALRSVMGQSSGLTSTGPQVQSLSRPLQTSRSLLVLRTARSSAVLFMASGAPAPLACSLRSRRPDRSSRARFARRDLTGLCVLLRSRRPDRFSRARFARRDLTGLRGLASLAAT